MEEEGAKADKRRANTKLKEDLKLMETPGVDVDIDGRVRAREASLRAKEEERKAEKNKAAMELLKRAQAREDAARGKADLGGEVVLTPQRAALEIPTQMSGETPRRLSLEERSHMLEMANSFSAPRHTPKP